VTKTLPILLAALAFALVPALSHAPVARAAAASCSSGFKSATIDGAHKCLRRGEFCARAYDTRAPRNYAYSHYGYRCVKRDARGNYHLT
jgi:hypothetical protein